ncbi:MAG: GIY-YIG nuclease family protein [Kiritimatiellia bacterium]
MVFHYVYIIVSRNAPGKYYIGFTDNLDDRLRHHNHGAVPSTRSFRP